MESIEFDNPKLKELKKILDELDKERTLSYSYETTKRKNNKIIKRLVEYDFNKYRNVDFFAQKIYNKKSRSKKN